MQTFYNEIQKHNWQEISDQIYSKNIDDVKLALTKDVLSLDDFQALISPAAQPYLEIMAEKSMQLTRKRFGNTMQMYIPLYLSNYCNNACVYCGFNHSNKITRTVLSLDDILTEANHIKSLGFGHILLVTGEDDKHCGVDYLTKVVDELHKQFALVSLEVQPLDTQDYRKLIDSGLHTVYIYQETYNEKNYRIYHPGGKKSNYQYRLETPDRLGTAGIHKIGLGALLGLEDWRVDSWFTALHLHYLERKYWQSKYSISFPRLRPHAGAFQPNSVTTEKDLVQLICAYRLLNEHVEISLSTRESPKFRDNMIKLGVTSFSAGSKTNPGGYASRQETLEQFSVHDDRSPQVVAQMVKDSGFEVVWKDWDHILQY